MPEKLNKPRVLGVLSGGDLPPEKLAAWAHSADIILAADGGANELFLVGVVPAATIGDLDSISNSTKGVQHCLVQDLDQNSSDCDKLLSYAEAQGFAEITLTCVEGDLLDHVLGTLASAARSPLSIRLALRRGIAYVLKGPAAVDLHLPDSTRLSLMPLTDCAGVSLSGVKWPLTDTTLSPMGLVSLSNQASGATQVEVKEGVAVLFLSHPKLEVPTW